MDAFESRLLTGKHVNEALVVATTHQLLVIPKRTTRTATTVCADYARVFGVKTWLYYGGLPAITVQHILGEIELIFHSDEAFYRDLLVHIVANGGAV